MGPRDPTEVMLTGIWEDLLGRGPIGIRDSFTALGGDSALLERMIARIEHVCGRKVPPSIRSGESTVEQLARALAQADSVVRAPRYRTFFGRNLESKTGGSATPFFFLHGDFNGSGLYCLNLAGHLGNDQPFYALAPHGLDDGLIPGTIEAMAPSHLETLTSLQPVGPYRLGGHCNGALVAFEIARQLQANGQEVERLILVAPKLPGHEPTALAKWCGYYLARLKRLARLPADEQAAFLRGKVRASLGVITHFPNFKVRRNPGNESPTAAWATSKPSQDRHDQLLQIYTRVMCRYKLRRYTGSVTILWPEGEPAQGPDGPAKSWHKAAPQLEIHQIPGEHLTCITTHVRALAENLRACLGSGPNVKI